MPIVSGSTHVRKKPTLIRQFQWETGINEGAARSLSLSLSHIGRTRLLLEETLHCIIHTAPPGGQVSYQSQCAESSSNCCFCPKTKVCEVLCHFYGITQSLTHTHNTLVGLIQQ